MNFIDQVAALQEIGQAVERAVVDEDGDDACSASRSFGGAR